eukprot:5800295-Pleurochrysis_carterae.AAC.1
MLTPSLRRHPCRALLPPSSRAVVRAVPRLHLLEPLLKVFHRSDGEVIGGRRLGGRRGGCGWRTGEQR